MAKPHKRLLLTSMMIAQLMSAALAAPPNPYDQWQATHLGCSDGAVLEESCPAGFTCGAAIFGDGFVQRTVTEDSGTQYFQTIITDSSGSPALDESYIRPGGTSDGIAGVPREDAAPAAPAPAGQTLASHGPYGYFINTGRNALTAVDLSDENALSIAGTIDLGAGEPRRLRTVLGSPNGAFLYAGHHGASEITIIRAFDLSVVATVAIDSPAVGLTVDAKGTRLYVTHASGTTVTVIDLAQRKVAAVLELTESIDKLAVHSDGRLYGLKLASAEVLTLDALNGAIVTRLRLTNAASAGELAIAPDGATLYVVLSMRDASFVYAMNTANGEARTGAQMLHGPVTRVYFSTGGRELLVNTVNVPQTTICGSALKNGFYVIDRATLLPTLIRHVDGMEEVIASTTDGGKLTLRASGALYTWRGEDVRPVTVLPFQHGIDPRSFVVSPVLRPTLHAEPNVEFGAVASGGSSIKSVAFVNNGALPITITGLILTPATTVNSPAAADFMLAADHCSGHVILPGESCSVDVEHTPAATGGRQAQMTAQTNDADVAALVTLSSTDKVAAATASAGSSGGGVFSPYLLIALLGLMVWRPRVSTRR